MALVSHLRPASRPHRHLPGLPARCHQPQVSESKQALCTHAENDAALPLETRGWQDAPQAALSAVCTPRSRWRRTGSVLSPVGTYSPSRRCWEHRLTPTRPKPRAPPGSHPELGPALEATIWPRSPLPVPSPTSLDNSDNEDRLRSCCRTAEPSCCVAAPHPLGADPTPTLPGRRFGAFGRERGWAAGPLSCGRPPPPRPAPVWIPHCLTSPVLLVLSSSCLAKPARCPGPSPCGTGASGWRTLGRHCEEGGGPGGGAGRQSCPALFGTEATTWNPAPRFSITRSQVLPLPNRLQVSLQGPAAALGLTHPTSRARGPSQTDPPGSAPDTPAPREQHFPREPKLQSCTDGEI